MIHPRLPSTLLLLLGICATAQVQAGNYTPGEQHLFTHESGDVPTDTYQYSLWVPKDIQEVPDLSWPAVFFLHGEDGRKHPKEATRNMVADRLMDQNGSNRRIDSAGEPADHATVPDLFADA